MILFHSLLLCIARSRFATDLPDLPEPRFACRSAALSMWLIASFPAAVLVIFVSLVCVAVKASGAGSSIVVAATVCVVVVVATVSVRGVAVTSLVGSGSFVRHL